MLFLIGLGLAVAIALVWQFTAKRNTEAAFFVGRFIIACIGVLGPPLFGLYFVIVAHNLDGL